MGLFGSRKPRRSRDVDAGGPLHAELPAPSRDGLCHPIPAELCGPTIQADPLDPNLKHQKLRSSRAEGVGNWLLRTDEFINWNTGEDGVASPVLFCYGEAGVGKTHIGFELTFLWGNGRLNESILVQLPGYRHPAQFETRGSGYNVSIL